MCRPSRHTEPRVEAVRFVSMASAEPAPNSTGAKDAKSAIRGGPISRAIDQFQGSLHAIRHLDERIAPVAIALDTERLAPTALSAVRRLPAPRRALLEAWFAKELEASPSADDSPQLEPDESDQVAPSSPTDTPRSAPDASSSPNEGLASGETELHKILGTREAAVELRQHLYHTTISPPRASVLRGSLLVTAFGTFEVLVGFLMQHYFLANPGALGEEPKFSLKDLQGFATLDDARDAAVATQVDSLLQRDFDSWEKWFRERLQLNLDSLCVDRQALAEMLQRRNVIVHNNGRVSRQYLRRLADRSDLPELNTPLPVDGEYLESALDSLEALGILLGTGVWSKLYPSEEDLAVTLLSNRAYKLLLAERWVVARKVCDVARVLKTDASTRYVFTANCWLAEKRLGNFATVREDVEKWEVSGLAPEFKFVRYVLLDDLDAAFPLAKQLLDGNFLDAATLAEWPVLAAFRDDPRYQKLCPDVAASGHEGKSPP